MERTVGTVAMGLRAPIIKEGDNVVDFVVDAVLNSSKSEGFSIDDRDVVTLTESLVARAQGNYASVDHIAKDVKDKFGDDTIGIIFPILSRNRFATCLKGIAKSAKKLVIMLSYPSDEVGNHLIDLDSLDEKNINPYTDVLTEEKFKELFGSVKHPFTGVDYIEFYKSIAEECGTPCEIILSNRAETILEYTKSVIYCDIHTRHRSKRILEENGGEKIFGLEDILNKSIDGSGYNEEYGLLGSNNATQSTVKLFPRENQPVVDNIQKILREKTGKDLEVMVYGDGAFKDPVGQIWELADPVVSPGWTSGLLGTPEEVKLKYIVDSEMSDLKGAEVEDAIRAKINSSGEGIDINSSLGTTPRRLTDLLGTLCDLTSGSGDKGTPIVHIQGYFDNYASN